MKKTCDNCIHNVLKIDIFRPKVAIAAGEQVEAGVDMPMVVEQVMDGITRSLTKVLPGLDFKVGHIGPGNTVVTEDEDNGILPA